MYSRPVSWKRDEDGGDAQTHFTYDLAKVAPLLGLLELLFVDERVQISMVAILEDNHCLMGSSAEAEKRGETAPKISRPPNKSMNRTTFRCFSRRVMAASCVSAESTFWLGALTTLAATNSLLRLRM
jgi:hypothetical protein